MRLLITGCAGFVGSALARHTVLDLGWSVVGVDAMTYAATRESLLAVEGNPRFELIVADIRDQDAMAALLARVQPEAIAHLAAETHVDRSIDDPEAFLQANVIGTHRLARAALTYRDTLPAADADRFRFLHVSTDEVFGALGPTGAFSEASAYAPRSPYAASKAASDHFVRAFHETFGLPVLISNCSNNYGPFQFPEKLIPLMILNGLEGRPMPLYGDGLQVRDWIAVEDHAAALALILEKGAVGETYLVGGRCERTNRALVEALCAELDRLAPAAAAHARLITPAPDRPGHDRRYAIDPSKIEQLCGWRARMSLEEGLMRTAVWYARNACWWTPLREGRYQGQRLGLGKQGA
ncbi:MAG: dTDP-glucose 4,6-dehydratase [Caulobacterales bacterium]